MLEKLVAKKIIISAPLSVEYFSERTPSFLKLGIEKIDVSLQNWALVWSDSFSEEDWREVQLIKLKTILVHAGRNVPYWQKLFKKINFEPESFKNFEDLQKIPILTRNDLKKIPIRDLIAKNIPKWRFVEAATSGSTGEPFSFFQDGRDLFRRRINTFHEFRYAGINPTKKILIIGLEHHKDIYGLGIRIDLATIENNFLRINEVYPQIECLKPEVLITTPALLKRFVYFLKKDGRNFYFKKIFYRGESFKEGERKELEFFLQSKFISTYGTMECSLVGLQCERGSMHTAPWMNYVEIVDWNGRMLGFNKDGDIVITFFENYAMPFIRYRIGDKGTIKNEGCFCGKVSFIIESSGRIANADLDFIRFPYYDAISVQFLMQHFAVNYSHDLMSIQFEQSDNHTLLMRYVSAHSISIATKVKIERFLKSFFNDDIKVILEEVDFLVPNKQGKIPPFVLPNIHKYPNQ